MTALKRYSQTEPVRLFVILAGLLPIITDGLVIFNLVDFSVDQIAYLNGVPVLVGAVLGYTVVRERVTPVTPALIKPLFRRRTEGLVDARVDADPNDHQFIAFLGDHGMFLCPATAGEVVVQVVTPTGTVSVDPGQIEYIAPSAEYDARWKAELPDWSHLGEHSVVFSQDGDVIIYTVMVTPPPQYRPTLIGGST